MAEFGPVSFDELLRIKIMGLGIERDKFFEFKDKHTIGDVKAGRVR